MDKSHSQNDRLAVRKQTSAEHLGCDYWKCQESSSFAGAYSQWKGTVVMTPCSSTLGFCRLETQMYILLPAFQGVTPHPPLRIQPDMSLGLFPLILVTHPPTAKTLSALVSGLLIARPSTLTIFQVAAQDLAPPERRRLWPFHWELIISFQKKFVLK